MLRASPLSRLLRLRVRYLPATLWPALVIGGLLSAAVFGFEEMAEGWLGDMTLVHAGVGAAVGLGLVTVSALLLGRQRMEVAVRLAAMELPDAVIEVRADGRISSANEPAERIFRPRTSRWLPGRALKELVIPAHRLRMIAFASVPASDPDGGERLSVRGLRAGEEEFDLEVGHLRLASDRSGTALLLLSDVTEQVELRARMAQVSRMEGVSELAGSVAHDVNNILQIIVMQAELLRANPATSRVAEVLSDASSRAAELLRRLRGRQQPERRSFFSCDVNDTVERTVSLLRPVLGGMPVVTDLTEDLPAVVNEPDGLESALTNLLINARDATAGRGSVTVRTVPGTAAGGAAGRGAGGAGVVRISVADDGPGVPQSLRSHIFDRFFSTKPPDQGTGLGLAIVRDTMDAIGGSVTLAAGDGVGATFVLHVPVWNPQRRTTEPE